VEEIFKEFFCNFLAGNMPYLEKVCAKEGLAVVKGMSPGGRLSYGNINMMISWTVNTHFHRWTDPRQEQSLLYIQYRGSGDQLQTQSEGWTNQGGRRGSDC